MVTALLIGGCSAESASSGSEAERRAEQKTVPSPTIVTSGGTLLRLVGPARTSATAQRAESDPSANSADHSLENLTPEELADALRPVTVIDGNEYIGDPDLTSAEKVLDEIRNRDRQPVSEATPDRGTPSLADGLRKSILGSAAVFGTDDRSTVTNTTVNPYSAQVAQWYDITSTTYYGCSATLIGNRTALSAAHCFHTGVGGSWRPTYTWAVGARVTYPSNPYPYGTQFGCYTAYIPQAYITTNSSSPLYDYAVIDYGCGLTPGASASKLLWGVWADAAIDGNAGYVYGYPVQGSYPSLRGMGVGASQVNLSVFYPNYVFYQNLDTSEGQSGAAFFQNIFGGYNASAIHVGSWDSDENVGRRITSDVASFVSANSVEY